MIIERKDLFNREEPKIQRRNLVRAEMDSYDSSAFPGSRQWRQNQSDRAAIKAFDAAHPEVLAEIKAGDEAAKAAKMDAEAAKSPAEAVWRNIVPPPYHDE